MGFTNQLWSLAEEQAGVLDIGVRYDIEDASLHFKVERETITFHLDLFNPRNGLAGIMGHILIDYIGGHVPGMCLDAACN